MTKLNEQGTIADIPLRSTSRLYYVRVEGDQPVDEGWVTVDEAKKMNADDRRMHGSPINRYFQDVAAANAFTQSMGAAPPMGDPMGAPSPDDMGAPPGEEMLPGDDMSMGAEDEFDLGMEDEGGMGMDMEDEGDLEFSDEDLGLDDMGDDLDLGLDDEEFEDELDFEDEKELEIVVPRRIRLVPESMQEKAPTFRGEPRFAGGYPGSPISSEEPLPDEETPEANRLGKMGWLDKLDAAVKGVTDGEGLDDMYETMSDEDWEYMFTLIDEAWERGDNPHKALSILQDFHPFKQYVKEPEEPEEEPWSEAPAGSVNPGAYQMEVTTALMSDPSGPRIAQAMMSDSEWYEIMSQIMMDGITRGTSPEQTARKIIDAFQNRGDQGTGGGGEDWGPDLPWAEAAERHGNTLLEHSEPVSFEDMVSETLFPVGQQQKQPQAAAQGMPFPTVPAKKKARRRPATAAPQNTRPVRRAPSGPPADPLMRGGMHSMRRESQTTEAGVIEALINGDISVKQALDEQAMGTAGQVAYNPRDQAVLGRQVGAHTQVKQPQIQWGQQRQQQQQPQIPADLQPLYQQYQQAVQSGDQNTAAQLKNQLAFDLQLQGIDPRTVLG